MDLFFERSEIKEFSIWYFCDLHAAQLKQPHRDPSLAAGHRACRAQDLGLFPYSANHCVFSLCPSVKWIYFFEHSKSNEFTIRTEDRFLTPLRESLCIFSAALCVMDLFFERSESNGFSI
jgi:hypothetical protein